MKRDLDPDVTAKRTPAPDDFDPEDSVEMTAERVKLEAGDDIEMTLQRPKLDRHHVGLAAGTGDPGDPLDHLDLDSVREVHDSSHDHHSHDEDDDDDADAGETMLRADLAAASEPTAQDGAEGQDEDLRSTDKKPPEMLGDQLHPMPADMMLDEPPMTERQERLDSIDDPIDHIDTPPLIEPVDDDEPEALAAAPTPPAMAPRRRPSTSRNIIRRANAPSLPGPMNVPAATGSIARNPNVATGSQQLGRDILARGSHADRRLPSEPEVTAKRPHMPDLTTKRPSVKRELPPGASMSDLEPTGIAAPPVEIEDRPTTNLDPGERGLIAAILAGNEASRLVYADWLQRHGEAARAEYMRVEHDLHDMPADDMRHAEAMERLRYLATRISIDWRSRVARGPIEGCRAVGVSCPGAWNALPTPEGGDDVRSCVTCHHEVFYCATVELAQIRARNNERVVVDVTCDRVTGDLGEPCIQCQSFVPPDARFCPHCGQSMQRVMMNGY